MTFTGDAASDSIMDMEHFGRKSWVNDGAEERLMILYIRQSTRIDKSTRDITMFSII